MTWALEEVPNTIVIGQGVADHKAIFGTTSKLSDRFPSRVIETPLAEESITGICIGAALNGIYPINTHIRADFSLLAFNQIINLAAKYRYMFGGLFEIPMLIRMVVGRSWGQGAQHSQSLQSLLAHIPGLAVVMPSSPETLVPTYQEAIRSFRGPVIGIEHRLLYELSFTAESWDSPKPLFDSRVVVPGSDLTIVATSVMVLEAKRATKFLQSFGISAEVIDLHSISHPSYDLVLQSVAKTGRLMVVDTSWAAFGVASEVSRQVAEFDPRIFKVPMRTLAMQPAPCPTAKALEDEFYPNVRQIVREALGVCGDNSPREPDLPPNESMTDYYKHFQGPF
jgi:pyruvate dehydrogenase E1 component beta subunit